MQWCFGDILSALCIVSWQWKRNQNFLESQSPWNCCFWMLVVTMQAHSKSSYPITWSSGFCNNFCARAPQRPIRSPIDGDSHWHCPGATWRDMVRVRGHRRWPWRSRPCGIKGTNHLWRNLRCFYGDRKCDPVTHHISPPWSACWGLLA